MSAIPSSRQPKIERQLSQKILNFISPAPNLNFEQIEENVSEEDNEQSNPNFRETVRATSSLRKYRSISTLRPVSSGEHIRNPITKERQMLLDKTENLLSQISETQQ